MIGLAILVKEQKADCTDDRISHASEGTESKLYWWSI